MFRPNGRTPKLGEKVFNKDLAEILRRIGNLGAMGGFYTGEVARAIVEAVRDIGGVITLDDLASHVTEIRAPLEIQYKDYNIYETPLPTQGLVALLALKVFEKVTFRRMKIEPTPLSL